MFKIERVETTLSGKPLFIETGKLAKQADGAVLVGFGDTRVLVTVCSSKEPKALDFFPLTVEFAEKFYASGKIPGSFPRREGRPTQEATLSARMIDRPIRPLFPEGYRYDTQVVATILSVDPTADVDVAAAIGTSAALSLSSIPFMGPTAACRVGRIEGKFVLNPSWSDIENGVTDMEILVAGTKNAIMMVEGGAREVPEKDVLEGILLAHAEIKRLITVIEDLREKAGKPKKAFTPVSIDQTLVQQIETLVSSDVTAALQTKDKGIRSAKIDAAKAKALQLAEAKPDTEKAAFIKTINGVFETVHYNLMRAMILDKGARIDGRDMKTVRPIEVETGLLPRSHGSGLFTRGETQVLSVVTLGTSDDEAIIDTMFQRGMRKFMLHYNFAPFSVGEAGRMGTPGRREIGHGALAERSIKAMMPSYEKFPYTLRIVCETLESNGSSSMGSVCSTSMALMDAGVPFVNPVAGIAMGLIKEGSKVAILTDILGDEDHLGDMDFKVAGTKNGITGIQMDIKIEGVDEAIMRQALSQARDGRLHILNEMSKAISAPKTTMSQFAPRITTLKIPVDKIREVIGSGGKVIKDIVAKSGAKVEINDDGVIQIATNDQSACDKAMQMINDIIAEAVIGKNYVGKVKKIVEFGAFIGILPNQDGLLHISEIAHERVARVEDYLKEGDDIEVRVLEIDRAGKIRLSRKVLLPPPTKSTPAGGSGQGPRPLN